MELLVIIIYAAILGLAAPYVNVHSDDYGQLVPSSIALNAGAILWGVLIWTGLGTANAWTWIIVMVSMPVAMAIGANRLAAARKVADEAALVSIKTGKAGSKAQAEAADSAGEDVYVTV